MEKKNQHFSVESFKKLDASSYDESEYCVGKMKFLSTRPNAHGIVFSEDVLMRDASTILGTWVVADFNGVDMTTHTPDEYIIGIVPKEQEVEFVRDEDGFLDAYVDVVLSKRYSRKECNVFLSDNHRNVSIEFNYSHEDDDEDTVVSFTIRGTTILGLGVRPSVPGADITITRFSEEDANTFFSKIHGDSLTALQRFAKERKEAMAESKTYKIDKSKDSLSTTPWGEVDKTSMRNKIMEASNRASLVKSVYMLVEDGWEDAPSEHLKYPVMQLKGDTFVYNRDGLASALGYAKKENESSVVSKIEKIYKKLGLDNPDEKEGEAKMSKEIEFAAVDIGDMWRQVSKAIHAHADWRYCIEGLYEEDNKKFAIITDDDGLYRLDFSYTEDGVTLADKIIEVKKEFVETDSVLKFAEPEDVEKYKKFSDESDDKDPKDDDDDDDDEDDDDEGEDKEEKMSLEDLEAECARLKSEIESRDNIIMEKDKELEGLRTFKAGVEEQEKMSAVESLLAEVKGCMSEDKYKEFRDEGIACSRDEIDGWSNKVKAFCFEASQNKPNKKKSGIMSMSAPMSHDDGQDSGDVWARMKKKFG